MCWSASLTIPSAASPNCCRGTCQATQKPPSPDGRSPRHRTLTEWALIRTLIPPAKPGGNKRTVEVRAVVNGVMYILSTGCQWAA
ncbi:transposase, partial [Siccirubricoccus deserti]|nr:transposase [Siccirubricoccus deserti]